jgi:hypothetical protein
VSNLRLERQAGKCLLQRCGKFVVFERFLTLPGIQKHARTSAES